MVQYSIYAEEYYGDDCFFTIDIFDASQADAYVDFIYEDAVEE